MTAPHFYRLLLLLLLFVPTAAYLQNTPLTGRVVNTGYQAIKAALITVKETGYTTHTDSSGYFTLPNARTGQTLIVSAVSYDTSYFLIRSTATPLLIPLTTLEKSLDEVTIVSDGYQDIPRERATGSFVKIDQATLNQQVGTNILSRLNHVTSSLLVNTGKSNTNPQNTTGITIRGLSTINGPLDPLIVLDGFIYEGNIANINPNDVESISILKDAAAASIWGSRAGNGVIVIQTKRGRKNQKTEVSGMSNVLISQKPALDYLPQVSVQDYIQLEAFLFDKGYFNNILNTRWQAVTPAVLIFNDRRNGIITAADSMTAIDQLKKQDSREAYLQDFYTYPVTQQYALAMRGGGVNNSFHFSVNYDHTLSERYDKFKKLNLKFDQQVQLAPSLQLTIGALYTNSQSSSGRPAFNSITVGGRQVPYLQFTNEEGEAIPVALSHNLRYLDTVGAGKLLDWHYYPATNYKHEVQEARLQELFAYAGLRYKILKGLDADLKYQYQHQQTITELHRTPESYSARHQVNLFSELNRSTGVVRYGVPIGGIRTIDVNTRSSYTLRGQLNLNQARGKHAVHAILGGELRESNGNAENNTLFGYYPDPLVHTKVDFANAYRTFITGGAQFIPFSPSVVATTQRFVSAYLNGAYTLLDKYTLSVSARRDAANVFGLSTNDQWNPLWSAGGSWQISREKFYRSQLLPLLKLRVTYGYSGNVDLSRSSIAVGRYFAAGTTTNLPYARVTTLNNPSLRWEKAGQFNMGIDFGFRNNRISGSLEAFRKYGSDLYGSAVYDYTTWGFTPELTRNVAAMQGTGIDLVVHTINIKRMIKWNSSLLASYITNKTTRYDNTTAANIITIVGGGTNITPQVNKPLYAIAAYRWAGLDGNGNPQGYLQGTPSTNYAAIFADAQTKGLESGTIQYIGTASPTFFGSVINSFQYKQLSLSINVSFKAGYYFRKPSLSYGNLINTGVGHTEYANRWLAAGDEANTNVPGFIYPNISARDQFYNNSVIHILKGDHLRLEYINLGYTLPVMPRFKVLFKELTISLNAANIGLLWRANKYGLDPDYPNALFPTRQLAAGLKFIL